MEFYKTYTNFQNQLTIILTISVLHMQINMNSCMLKYHIPLFLTPPLILWSLFIERENISKRFPFSYELLIDIFNIGAGGLVLLILKPNSWPGALQFCSQTVYTPPYALSFLLGDIMVFGTMLKLYIYYISKGLVSNAWILFAISCLIGITYVIIVDEVVYA